MTLPSLPLPVPDYTPFRTAPWPLTMGLAALDLHHWIEPDECFISDLREKERLLHECHQDVFAALPSAAAGSAEVLALLAEHLPARFPMLYQREGHWLHNVSTGCRWSLTESTLHPLDLAGRLVQEDLCLLQQVEGTAYHLVGGSVCFPTRWRLAEKLGKSLGAIHGPVPGYTEHLSVPMDRLLHRLKVEHPVWRLNWGLIDHPALFQPTGHGQLTHNPHITVDNAGDMVWLRMERQTLRRLPRSGDVLFTIRVHVRPLHTLATHPERAAALAAAIRAMPPAMHQYKSFLPFLEAALAWLDHIAASSRIQG